MAALPPVPRFFMYEGSELDSLAGVSSLKELHMHMIGTKSRV